jgi:serine/threonine protein phosphatase PrpC
VIQLYAEGTTDVGRKRDHNEDRIFCDPTLGLYIVCDGMGGHEAGEVAAEMVTDHLVEAMSEAVGSELGASEEAVAEALGDALERALTDANAAVNTFALEQGQKRGMGTTCTAMIAHGAHATICHVGDSRCYLVRDGRLYQMTQDHSWVAEMVRLGRMTKQEAERSPQRNLLVRSVGTQPVVKVDRLPLDLVANDNVLICSDGLHSYFASPSELVELLQRGDVAQLPKDFVSLACSRGGHDNVSAVVVRMPSADEMPPSHRDPKAELELLGKIELFADFELPELVRIRGAASLVGFADGESVTVKGEQGDAMYVLVEGRAMVAVEEEVLTTLSVGSHVGDIVVPFDLAEQAIRLLVVTDLAVDLVPVARVLSAEGSSDVASVVDRARDAAGEVFGHLAFHLDPALQPAAGLVEIEVGVDIVAPVIVTDADVAFMVALLIGVDVPVVAHLSVIELGFVSHHFAATRLLCVAALNGLLRRVVRGLNARHRGDSVRDRVIAIIVQSAREL